MIIYRCVQFSKWKRTPTLPTKHLVVRFIFSFFIQLDMGGIGVKLNAVLARQSLTLFFPLSRHAQGTEHSMTNAFLPHYLFKWNTFQLQLSIKNLQEFALLSTQRNHFKVSPWGKSPHTPVNVWIITNRFAPRQIKNVKKNCFLFWCKLPFKEMTENLVVKVHVLTKCALGKQKKL